MTDTKRLPDVEALAMNGAIARRIASLRKARQLSFDELAARSSVSKGMLVQIEQGRANPSIATLCRVAAALRVSVADLVASGGDSAHPIELVAPQDTRTLWTGEQGGSASLIVGARGPDMLELWHWVLYPGERFEARAHGAGTVELIHVRSGSLVLELDGTVYVVASGHSAIANTDRPHAYACRGRRRTEFTMVVSEHASD